MKSKQHPFSLFKKSKSTTQQSLVIGVFSILSLLFMCLSCEEDDYGNGYNPIYSKSDNVSFTNVIFFLNPYLDIDGQKQSLVTDTLYNVLIKINGQHEFSSHSLDVGIIDAHSIETVGAFNTTTESISYPVIIDVRIAPKSFETAGQYADVLNNLLTLSPGTYVCQIVSFDVKTTTGELTTIQIPALSLPLKIEENVTGCSLGSFPISVKH